MEKIHLMVLMKTSMEISFWCVSQFYYKSLALLSFPAVLRYITVLIVYVDSTMQKAYLFFKRSVLSLCTASTHEGSCLG